MNVPPAIPAATPPKKTSGLAVASLALGVLSLLGFFFLLVPPILAIVFGHIALSQIKSDPTRSGRGLGIAGLVTGYLSLVMIPLIGLLAAMAIPAFQKVREASLQKVIQNDARQIGAAAQQYMLENDVKSVTFGLTSEGEVSGPLSSYVPRLSPGVEVVDGVIKDETDGFSLRHPNFRSGKVVEFDTEGRPLP